MRPLCKQYIYIFQYIYIIREWFVQRGPPLSKCSMVNTVLELLRANNSWKEKEEEGCRFRSKAKTMHPSRFFKSLWGREEGRGRGSKPEIALSCDPTPSPGRDYHPWRAFNPLATFFSIHFPANVVYRLPSRRGKELCNLERIGNRWYKRSGVSRNNEKVRLG